MFDGFVDLEGRYRTAVVVTGADGQPVEPDEAPAYRLYGPDGFLMDGQLAEFDTVNDVHLWTPDIDCTANNGFVAGANYQIVITAVVDGDTITGRDLIRTFTVT